MYQLPWIHFVDTGHRNNKRRTTASLLCVSAYIHYGLAHLFIDQMRKFVLLIIWIPKVRILAWCSVTQSCLNLCDPMDCSTPDLLVSHHLLKFAQVHVHCISDSIQPSQPLMPSSYALNLSQRQGLFQRIGCSHQVTKILKLKLQHQSFQ